MENTEKPETVPQSSQSDEAPWEPQPVSAEVFHQDAWANINRAPYDEVSGVIFKRAANIKRVRYEPVEIAPEMPEPWQGNGLAIVRWLFSEQSGTEEGLLNGADFAFLHDLALLPGSATGQKANPGVNKIYYVIGGQGILYHHPSYGAPMIARPLRPGDAVLVREDELHSLANETVDIELRVVVVGLRGGGR